MATEFVSGVELGRRIGIDEKMIRKYRDRGLFKGAMGGPKGDQYDAEKCHELYRANLDPEAALKGLAGGAASPSEQRADVFGNNSLMRARTASATIDAQHKAIGLQRLKGDLITKAEARAAVRQAITIITERLDGAAGQIGPRVAGNASAAECEQIARTVINDIRRDIAAMAQAMDGVGNAT